MLAVLHSTRDAFLKVFQPDADAVQLRLFKQFARSLDASQPGIAKLARAAAAGDTAATADRLFAYASSRALMPKLRLTAWGTEEQHLARAAMAREDTFRLQGVSFRVPRRADGGLDWAHSGPNSDPEWSWFLNRLAHLHSAQVAWNKTGEECYRSLIEEQLVDWIRSHPRPQGVSFSASWRPLEAARRTTGCWLSICFPSDGVPILGAHATLLAWSSAIDHALVLRNHHSTGGNHLLSEMSALAAIALAWPEFTASGEWLEYAIATFNSQLVSQTYPDGSHTEMSNHYHRVATLEAQQFLNTLSNCGHHALHDELRPRVARMWDYLAGVMRPDGYGPLNNDGGLDHNASSLRNFGLDEAAPERRYIATYGRSGTEPAGPSSRYYPWAGQAITRSGWRHDAQWARFDMGPHGTDHQHADQLSIELMAGGRALLVDSGRYTYKPGPLRDYFIGAQAHNVVLLDGVGSIPPSDRIRAPMPALAHIGPRIQCFASQAKFPSSPGHGTGASTWTRALFYVEGQYWVVLDLLLAFGAREATVNWHFGPTCEVATHAHAAVTTDSQQSNLVLKPSEDLGGRLRLVKGQSGPVPKGWYSRNYNERVPCSVAEYQIPMLGPLAVAWLLHPAVTDDPRGEANRCQVRTHVESGRKCVVEVVLPDRQVELDRFTFDLRRFEMLQASTPMAGSRALDAPGVWSLDRHSHGAKVQHFSSPNAPSTA